MKLATLKDGTRDGKLVVVSKDLTRYCAADNIAPTMQAAIDNWDEVAPKLNALYTDVEHQTVPCERFHEREAHSPLPAPINGRMARPISTTSNWYAKHAAPKCPKVSTPTR